MCDITEKPKAGRPRKYFCKDDFDEAQKRYRATWYANNKQYVKEHRNLDREKERRKLRVKSGYFCIYSGDDMYVAFSQDIGSRARDIIKNLERKEKNTSFYDRFDTTKTYDWKILGFSDVKNDELQDVLIDDELSKNPNINFI